MMKRLLFLIVIFCALKTNAQNYLISFAGNGASETVSSVKVENLTKGTNLTLNGTDILRLTITTGINSIEDKQSSDLKIYPNPMTDNATLEFFPPVEGNAIISVCDMTGKTVVQIQNYLENSRQDFLLSGLRKGFYFINVKGNNYQYSNKLVSNGKSNGTLILDKVNNVTQAVDKNSEKTYTKGIKGNVDMAYTIGDRLKFTGISGNYSTVKTDIPTGDKTITFNFIACTDEDGNNYPIVEIGSQIWMAQNLKTKKFKDGTDIPLVSDAVAWDDLQSPGYCWYNNDEASNKDTYGALYSGWAVWSEKLCPAGWVVPSNEDWTILTTFLGGLSVAGGKLKETGFYHWSSPNTGATNETGFTALPGGVRDDKSAFSGLTDNCYFWIYSEPFYNPIGRPDIWTFFRYFTSNYGGVYQSINGPSGETDTLYVNNGLSVRCKLGSLPILTTSATSIRSTSVISGGNIINNGGAHISERGVCWSTSHNPTIEDAKTVNGTGTGIFIDTITGLTPENTYYLRAYATNGAGTGYGDEQTFSTPPSVTDADGNVYCAVIIGMQTWMTENLKTTKYKDETPIPFVTDPSAWAILNAPGYCWYNNDEASNKNTYGALYNWLTVNTGKLCPAGWHMPSDAEWHQLMLFLDPDAQLPANGIESQIDGGKLKESGTGHWTTPNTGATNESGFSALPGGYRSIDGSFSGIGTGGYLDSATEYNASSRYGRSMNYDNIDVVRGPYGNRRGLSVRCLKDN
jgi:uncharacterized protein (TIGR02145 family)